MSKILQIIAAKPNPAGKDKLYGTPRPEQLLGEWVDIQNTGTEPLRFSDMAVSHTLFDDRCQNTGRSERYWSGSGVQLLAPGQAVRVHTGRLRDQHLMLPADNQGAYWHAYANRDNFVLNNRCGDIVTVAWTDALGRTLTDTASYAPSQPEGAVLKRVGDRLVQTSNSAPAVYRRL